MADLLLRQIDERGWFGLQRCGSCGAPWELRCSYCGRDSSGNLVHVADLLRYGPESLLSKRDIERMQKPRPLPTTVPGPGLKVWR